MGLNTEKIGAAVADLYNYFENVSEADGPPVHTLLEDRDALAAGMYNELNMLLSAKSTTEKELFTEVKAVDTALGQYNNLAAAGLTRNDVFATHGTKTYEEAADA